jgi:hypothetical protein
MAKMEVQRFGHKAKTRVQGEVTRDLQWTEANCTMGATLGLAHT